MTTPAVETALPSASTFATPVDVARHWSGRPTVAVVDFDTLATNVRTIRSLIGPRVKLMSVVKANGYGHGAVPIGKAALAAGADELGVATVDEGVQLREAGVTVTILVMGPIGVDERARAIGNDLAIVVSDASFAHALAADAKMMIRKEPVSVHLKIDTGMNRFGVEPGLVVETARAILSHPELRLDGVMTHMSSADSDDPAETHRQNAVFDRCIAMLKEAGIDTSGHHAGNSATTLRFPQYHRDRVRVGVATYGLRPDTGFVLPGPMRPILTIHSRIARIHTLQPGDAVSYGMTYRATQEERAGLVPLGYADGYRRALSSRTWMGIAGSRADQIGRICMDQTVVRLPAGVDVSPGDLVTVVGNGSEATSPAPTLDELAEIAGTISYEMSTGLTARLPKLYVRGGQVVAIDDLSGYRELL
jgi:alanine racemase